MFKLEQLTSGTVVPAVKAEDVKQVWALRREVSKKHAGKKDIAIGVNLMTHACSPGADVEAVSFRASILEMALQEGELVPFQHGEEIDESVVQLFATFPFRAINVQPDGSFQLNGKEFEEELQKLAGPSA